MTFRNPSSFAAVALIVLVTSALTGVRSGVLPIGVDADSASVRSGLRPRTLVVTHGLAALVAAARDSLKKGAHTRRG